MNDNKIYRCLSCHQLFFPENMVHRMTGGVDSIDNICKPCYIKHIDNLAKSSVQFFSQKHSEEEIVNMTDNKNTKQVTIDGVTYAIEKGVNHPSHYAEGRKYEPIAVIQDWDLDFCLGNTVKYISRAGRKSSSSLDSLDKEIQDLEKAKWYLNYKIEELKKQKFDLGTNPYQE